MNNMLIKIIAVLLAVMVFLPSTAYAHRMVIEPKEDGKVWVGFDDGTTSSSVVVKVYDKDGELLEEGSLNSEGLFNYDAQSEAETLIAEDGMGHRVEWTVGDEAAYSDSWTKWLKILGVVIVLGGVAFFFTKKNTLKKSHS
ncbi:hypothetical protein PRVXT_002334 [Proteinivorax tanatarense]|uniref:Nickel transport protein n=1 Tax=Proteinivorax tanatarense TaxID=1260629 RepID=A0AAU7VJR9_9FIRM